MRLRNCARHRLAFTLGLGFLFMPACQTQEPESTAIPVRPAGIEITSPQPSREPLKNEIPPADLTDVMTAHFQGLGHMERFEYAEAAAAFRKVRSRAPGWIPGSINLAIALLNDSGVQAEQTKKAGGKLPRAISTKPSICLPQYWNEILPTRTLTSVAVSFSSSKDVWSTLMAISSE